MMIEIPSLKERPLKEKLQFIRLFFWMESRRLNAPVLVRAEVIRYMADEEYQGNVGQLKADIQVCCARAFLDGRTKRRSKMIVGMEALSGNKTEPISSGEHSVWRSWYRKMRYLHRICRQLRQLKRIMAGIFTVIWRNATVL